MKKFLAVFGFSALMVSASVSQAIYIEPYLGIYGVGTQKMTTPAASEGDLTGSMGLGLRLGYSFMGFSVGADFDTGNIDSKAASGVTTKIKTTNLGIFANFDVPVLPVRAYATYILDAKATPEGSVDQKGKGFKIGAGFTGLPFVALNIDYYLIKYDNIGGVTADNDVKFAVFSVSLPLDI